MIQTNVQEYINSMPYKQSAALMPLPHYGVPVGTGNFVLVVQESFANDWEHAHKNNMHLDVKNML